MSISLIESKRRAQRSVASTLVSVALHASAIVLAVFATANAGVVAVTVPEQSGPLIYKAPEPEHHAGARTHAARAGAPTDQVPTRAPIDVPTTIPTTIPDVLVGATTPDSIEFAGSHSSTGSATSTSGSGGHSGDSYFASQVEKPALPRTGNPTPRYPSLLEGSRVEGSVLAQFVVDTLGRVDLSTVKILESSNELFSASLREALPRWRFYPAEAGGRKVKQYVQLPLRFVAPHH